MNPKSVDNVDNFVDNLILLDLSCRVFVIQTVDHRHQTLD